MDVRRIRIFLGTVSDSEKIGYCYVCLVFLLYCHRSTERKFINIHGMENKREKACWAVMKLCG